MKEERPFLQIPLPSPEQELRLYEEWLKRKEQEEKEDENERIVIIDT